ncbi:MAG: DoxX family protein [Pseudomonadota bacterium]
MIRDRETPRFVAMILDWPVTALIARLALVGPYLIGGLTKLIDWQGAVAEQAHFGVQPAALFAAITIVVELLGPALILANRFVWLGTGMLGVFTLSAAIVANAFWTMTGAERFMATNAFFEHLGLVGGFILVAMLSRRASHAPA